MNKTAPRPPDKSSVDQLSEKLRTCLVIGGGSGFLGRRLVDTLLEQGCSVRILSDVPAKDLPADVPFIQGDIRHLEDVMRACEGVDTVFHVASIIWTSGFVRQETHDRVYAVNVTGTQNVIKACEACGVRRLIYTSSNNVVFDHEIENGDETLPYATKFIDIYTKTKVLAEQSVLEANGRSGLLTCALRPGGIYGPGDKVIFPRFIELLKKGCLFAIGDGKALGDIVYIDNVVNAHILAAAKLEDDSPVTGQAYFISDGEPSNYFIFVKPLMQAMGFRPIIPALPLRMVYAVAYLTEFCHYVVKSPKPFLTRMEVNKVGISNYFSIDKARRDLGYFPHVSPSQGIKQSIPYCLAILEGIEIVDRPHWGWWVSIFGGFTALGIFAFNADAYAFFAHHLTSLISQTHLIALFFVAILVHIGESLYAARLAEKAGLASTKWGWWFQTLLLGYPSLRLLIKRVKKLLSS